MPTLVIETGASKGTTVALGPGADLLLGTDTGCDVHLVDTRVSGRHCKLKEWKGRYFVKDLRSASGTFVNEQTVDQSELKDGDRLKVGDTVLAFVSDEGAGALVGKEIGGYRLLARIGMGGMGAVYRALQISLHREVALKILKPSLTKDQHFVEQFMREARAAGALNHPHICQVYDVGQAGNIYYYSMEFIPNGSVEDLLNKAAAPVPVDEAVRLVLEAARALEYAELKHIVHRDIKPANLMLTEMKQVKIADLGLARSLKESAEKEATGTLGTPHFISPEQALQKDVDIRSDIYSLGATFYRILTGKTPFEGATVQEILRKQVKEEPKPLRELRPDVPERVERVVQRMLRKDPAERHASAAELVLELESLRHKKHSRALVVGALVVAVLAVTGAVFAYVRGQREPEKIFVEKEKTDPSAERKLRETMNEKQRLQLELQAAGRSRSAERERDRRGSGWRPCAPWRPSTPARGSHRNPRARRTRPRQSSLARAMPGAPDRRRSRARPRSRAPRCWRRCKLTTSPGHMPPRATSARTPSTRMQASSR
ncbi:MAG: FHA domain-containing serine/threonine-protein kinase [Planctomycetota bacterium]